MSADDTSYEALRQKVAEVSVEVAFRRHLGSQGLLVTTEPPQPFSDPERHDAVLGGRRFDLRTALIRDRKRIEAMQRAPDGLREEWALIPAADVLAPERPDQDVFVFAFLTGLVTRSASELKRALGASQPCALLHCMPDAWKAPRTWRSMDPLTVSCRSPIRELEIHGQNEGRQHLSRTTALPPEREVKLESGLFAVSALQIQAPTRTAVRVRSAVHARPHIVMPRDWENIWVYGMEISIAGYLTRKEFRSRARPLRRSPRSQTRLRPRTTYLAVPVGQLEPVAGLLQAARSWQASGR